MRIALIPSSETLLVKLLPFEIPQPHRPDLSGPGRTELPPAFLRRRCWEPPDGGICWRVSSTGNKSVLGEADGDDPEAKMSLKVIVIIVHFLFLLQLKELPLFESASSHIILLTENEK